MQSDWVKWPVNETTNLLKSEPPCRQTKVWHDAIRIIRRTDPSPKVKQHARALTSLAQSQGRRGMEEGKKEGRRRRRAT